MQSSALHAACLPAAVADTTALVRGPTPTECPVLRPAAAPQQVLVPPSLIQTLPTVGGIFSQDGTWE